MVATPQQGLYVGMNGSTEPNQVWFQATLFTADRLSRLEVYRAAIAAGFYTDQCSDTVDGPAASRAFGRHTSRPRDGGGD
jgi:hypothetical protein